MKMAYRVLAYVIALGVALQAAAVALAFAGLAAWVEGGGVFDQAFFESENATFPGLLGIIFHGMFGMVGMPVLGLLLLISSFFVKVPGAIKWALIVFGSIVLQVVFGILGHSVYWLGGVHGFFAFVVLGSSVIAASRVARAQKAATTAMPTSTPTAAEVA